MIYGSVPGAEKSTQDCDKLGHQLALIPEKEKEKKHVRLLSDLLIQVLALWHPGAHQRAHA